MRVVGLAVGLRVGLRVVGLAVGLRVGLRVVGVVGFLVSVDVGTDVGLDVGLRELGLDVIGDSEGLYVGQSVSVLGEYVG